MLSQIYLCSFHRQGEFGSENARKRNGKGKEEEKKRKDKGKIRGKEIEAERKMSPDANPGFIVQACVAN